MRGFIRLGDNDVHPCDDLDVARITAVFLPRETTYGVDGRTDLLRSLTAYENGFCMLGAELPPRLRRAGLEKQRRALRTRFAQMRSWHLEVFALVMDLPHPLRDRILPFLLVLDDGVVAPTAFPELIHGVHVLVRDAIALVVFDLGVETEVPRRAVQIRRDDVPRHAALGQVVDGRKAPRERVGQVVGRAGRDAEDEVRGRGGHGGDGVEGVVDGELGARGDGGRYVGGALVDVVAAQDVGDEEGVEVRFVERAGEGGPEGDFFVLGRFVSGVLPEARGEMAGRGDDEGIED